MLGLITQQWQGVLRWALGTLGALAMARGYVSESQWGNIAALLTTIVGALVNLAPLVWSIWSNQAKIIHATSNKLASQGK